MLLQIRCSSSSSLLRVKFMSLVAKISSSFSLKLSTCSDSVVDNENEHQIPLSVIFTRHGFPPSLLKINPIIQTFDSADLQKSLSLLSSFDLPRNSLESLIRRCPGVLNFDFLNKCKAILSGIECMNIKDKIHIILECSSKFDLHPLDVAKIIRCLKKHYLKDDTIALIFEQSPTVALLDDEEIEKRVKFLKEEVGISAGDIDHVYRKFPTLLCFDVETRLKPLLEELILLGFHKSLVKNEIVREPRILSMELGQMSRYSEFQTGLKCRPLLKERILKKGIIRVGFELKLRVDCLCSHGLSTMEAVHVLWKEPRAIISPLADIEEKIVFLIDEMKHDVSSIIDVSQYLGAVDFNNLILPRYKISRFLVSNGYLDSEIGLKSLITLSRLRFYNMYVKPYPECQHKIPLLL